MVWLGFGLIAIFFAGISLFKILDAIEALEQRVAALEARQQPDKPLPPGLPPEYYKFVKGGQAENAGIAVPRPMERLLTEDKITRRG